MRRKVGLMVALLAVSACATDYRTQSAGAIAAAVSINDNAFSSVRNYSAPPIHNGTGWGMTYSAMLVASQDKKTQGVEHSLLVRWTYVDRQWAFFNAATLPGGTPLSLLTAERAVSSCRENLCTYAESYVIPLPLELLAGAKDGLQIAFNGQLGQYVVSLPASYVLGYLSGVAAALTPPATR